MVEKYVSVSIPKSLIDKIDEVIESNEFGYSSRAEFMKEAVREKLKQLGKLI